MPEGEELGLIEDGSGAEESGGEETFAETETEEESPGAESETPGEEGGPGGEEPPPSRALPTELRKAFREFIAGNPEFAKRFPRLERQLTDAMFKTSELGKLGGLQQLRSAAEVLENHGGPEGIREMAEEVEASRMMEEGFQQGDPVLIDTWAQEYPDGFKMLVGPALEKLATLDLAAHDRAISSPMYQTLDRCGVIGTVNDLEAAIAGERYEDIAKHFGALKNFLMELRNFASKAKAPDPLKADRDKLAQEREEMQTERVRGFYGHVRTDVNTQVMAYTNRLLRQELAGRKLRVDTANRLRKQVNEDLAAAVNTAPGYADRYKAVMGQGDHGRAVGFIVAAARQKLPQVIKRVLRDFNLGGKPGVTGMRRVAAGGGPRTGTTVAGRPKTADVDFTKTDKATWLGSLQGHGEAWLKNGKKARW